MRKEKSVKKKKKKFAWGYWSLVVLMLAVTGFIGYNLSDKVQKQRVIDQEIASLEKEIEKFDRKNKSLRQYISYLKTDDFKEKEIKDKLNLVREGERLVLVRGDQDSSESLKQEESKEAKDSQVVIRRPNYYWWWHFLFSL